MTVEETLVVQVESLQATMILREKSIRRVEATNRLLADTVREFMTASAEVLEAFDDGIFVRDIKGDGQSGWAMKLLTPIRALGALKGLAEVGLEGIEGG